MNDFATVNGIYAEFFGKHTPARSAVEVARLPKDVLVEVEAIARYVVWLIILIPLIQSYYQLEVNDRKMALLDKYRVRSRYLTI